jgi:choloylglycine hydrolase
MKQIKRFSFSFFALLSLLIFQTQITHACTGVLLKTKSNESIFARTLEFPVDLESEIIFIPKGHTFTTIINDTKGMSWTNKYEILGINCFHLDSLIEGLNEKGLFVSGFYFPKYTKYKELNEVDRNSALSPWDFMSWALSQCSSVKELKERVHEITIVNSSSKKIPKDSPPTFHFMAFDKTGACVVIDPLNGELKFFDNPIGVMSNSPNFDWHLTNLKNYVNMSRFNPPTKNINGLEIAPMGAGAGMLGLPGDFTPPSRFIRMAVLSMLSTQADNAKDGVVLGWNLINNVNIPKGTISESMGNQKVSDYTSWVVVWDVNSPSIHFRTYDNPNI